MKTKVILGIAVILILAIALTSGASNMGFKLSMATSAGVPKVISLPYYNSYSTQTAAYLRNDIIAAGGTGVSVATWNGTAWITYSGTLNNFTLTPGLGYKVQTTNNVSNWIIVGSHNPSTSLSFSAGVPKVVSVPYHTTATNAAGLRNEVIAAGGTGVSVATWNGSAWITYSGTLNNFTLTPGLGYKIQTTNNVASWTPAHY